MARHQQYPPVPRTIASIADARDLRASIAEILAKEPLDASLLRQAVWTYVGTERDAGVSPGRVILSLTDVIERASATPTELRASLTRDVILWCVEAYFGHLGGDVFRIISVDAGVPWSSAHPGATE